MSCFHLLLARVGAGEHGVLRDDDAGLVLHGVDDGLDIHVVGDVAAAVADVDAQAPLAGRKIAHAGTFRLSRWAATWAAAAPAWRIESAMSLAPDAVPATKTPGMLVRPGSMSSLGSAT